MSNIDWKAVTPLLLIVGLTGVAIGGAVGTFWVGPKVVKSKEKKKAKKELAKTAESKRSAETNKTAEKKKVTREYQQ